MERRVCYGPYPQMPGSLPWWHGSRSYLSFLYAKLPYFSEMHFIREPVAYRLAVGNGNRTSVVEGGWPPSISASQPAACCSGIPQLGSVPWAQPLLSCPLPDADAGTALGSGYA